MDQYSIVYVGGDQPATAKEGKPHYTKYQEWLSFLGDSAVSPMNPLKNTSTVTTDGTITDASTTNIPASTTIKAQSISAALEIAKACPFLNIGNSLEVSRLRQINHC